MRMKTILTFALVTLLASVAWGAAGDDFVKKIDRDVAAGTMTFEDGLLAKFHHAFAPERLSAELKSAASGPSKCFTPVVAEYMEHRDELSPETVAIIEAYLAGPDKEAAETYISPSGHFQFTYYLSGSNAVSGVDVDPANGIPDYVERCAEYMDFAWQREVDEMHFTAPVVTDYYPVSFENMEYYGYTQYLGGGRSRIVLHNTFLGFPPNDDPDGDQLGAAKVTCAHEFKHATQYGGGTHGMGGWVELDAVWAEEEVYPATNDYHNYLPYGSSISDPELPLDSGGSGSYEDCIWQIWMSETYTYQIIVDHMLMRYAHPTWNVMYTYDQVLQDYGSSVEEGWRDFTTWNSAVYTFWGSPGYGYPDALDMTAPGFNYITSSYPYTVNGTVNKIAANFVRCMAIGGVDKQMEVEFQGQSGYQYTVMAVVYYTDGSLVAEPIELDANAYALEQVNVNLTDVFKAAVIVGNPNYLSTTPRPYTLTVRQADVTTPVGQNPPSILALDDVYPNPFNPRTNIHFSLPQAGRAELQVVDLSGRRIATIFSGELAAGDHDMTWDGRDGAGRNVAAGTYFALLRADGRMAATKMVLAK